MDDEAPLFSPPPGPPDGSLLLREERAAASAPFLFSGEAMQDLEKRGTFTGERLYAQRPETYREIVRLLAEGTISMRQIAAVCAVSTNTVAAVRDREGIPIEALKQQILKSVRLGLQLCAERVVELAPTMSARDAIVGVGVLGEKHQLLSGEATSIVRKEEQVRHEDLNALLDALPAADATVVEEMGSSGRMGAQKGGEIGSGSGSEAHTSDIESGVFSGASSLMDNDLQDSCYPLGNAQSNNNGRLAGVGEASGEGGGQGGEGVHEVGGG